jgi:hypothetical protein
MGSQQVRRRRTGRLTWVCRCSRPTHHDLGVQTAYSGHPERSQLPKPVLGVQLVARRFADEFKNIRVFWWPDDSFQLERM